MPNDSGYSKGMVVVAHADDAEFGCSGTVAKWCNQGMDFTYVLCTDGSKGSDDPGMTSEALAAIRQKEQRNACNVLGVKEVVFLGYPDAMLEASISLRRDITKAIRRYKPDVVICQSPVRSFVGRGYLSHPDHIAAGEATLSAIFPSARDRLTFPELLEEGLEPHKVEEVLIMGWDRSDINKWIELTLEEVKIATKALEQHASQLSNPAVGEMMMKGRARAGLAGGMLYAEAFKSILL
ncbi:PIG-L family deacetylase [SAR202 cluster bacterium AC-409-J13_OGT_754m]|nr:PIG-L family deacetylase [SAR202 cluster bacterium AC-409-J13_OGT_754m]